MDQEKSPKEKIDEAITVAVEYGSCDGAHHKMWVIDQMLRALMGPTEYAEYCKDCEETYGEKPDCGIAP